MSPGDVDRPLVVAHRGSSATAPENTLASFREAVRAGADMIELDVRMTRDFELAVIHDSTLERTTSGTGPVCARTAAELKSLDAGGWFSPRFRDERVPLLREVMAAVPLRVILNIEVKTDGDRRKNLALEESCILAVREHRRERRALVSSFDHLFLTRLHHMDPDIFTGVLFRPIQDFRRRPSVLARRTGSVAFICGLSHLRARQIRDAHENNLTVASYLVNTARQLAAAKRLGVDAVITDDPARILRLLHRLKGARSRP